MLNKTIGIIVLVIILATVVAGIRVGCNKKSNLNKGENNMTTTAPKIPPIDTIMPVKTETATFALGCFWGSDSRFGSIEGVIRTRVGYAGGATSNPTYYNLGDHSETVQLDFDPTKISYEELLEVFWDSHNPTTPSWSRQYMSIIFYHNEDQKNVDLASMRRKADLLGQAIITEVIPFSELYLAEDYHQKYYLQGEQELFNEFTAIYTDISQLIRSTAAARVNGYIGGYGKLESLEEQLDSFSLSTTGNERLLQIGSRLLSKTN